MTNDDGRILDRLAEAITDEAAIDWDAEEAAHPELAGSLRPLRLIERIAGVHRAPASVADGDAEPTLFTWGHLQVREELGEGSFGSVYRAYDPRLQRDVALKLLQPDRAGRRADRSRFLAEARRMARVQHPGVLAIHGVDEHDGRPGFWCDLLRGETLARQLEREGPRSAGEAAAIGLELCRALAAVHAAGVVHGDVKAANVMRDDRGRMVLMDFGAGREAGPGSAAGAATVVGTPLVLAPELFDGAEPSTASDLYAAGALLYLLVTGRYPVMAASVAELQRKLRAGQRVPLLERRPDLPTAFAAVVERSLSPDPDDRHRSAGAMASALARTLRTGDRARATTWFRRHRRFVTAVAAVAACAAVAGALLLRPGSPEADRTGGGAVPAVATTAPLTGEATLYRSLGGAREALPAGALVRPGDTLYLEFQGNRPAHVYILNEDAEGDVFLLFPLPGQDLTNPLTAGERHRLPGPHGGVPQDWQVTDGQGREAFLLVAATSAVGWLEEAMAAFPAASPTRPVTRARLAAADAAGTRGVEGLVPASPSADDHNAAAALAGIARLLSKHVPEPGGIWIRQFVVYNGGR